LRAQAGNTMRQLIQTRLQPVEPDRHGWLFKSRTTRYDETHDAESVIRRDFGVPSKVLHDQGLFITTRHAPHIPINDPCRFRFLGKVLKRNRKFPSSILIHNYPLGDPTPSPADIEMTMVIVEVAKPLGISVHDHIIVGKEGHASFKG
jgi:RadC-like JAB domain